MPYLSIEEEFVAEIEKQKNCYAVKLVFIIPTTDTKTDTFCFQL
jgi:hypothetical protein